MSRHRLFISYRRDDAAGYAGRLEESLERALGRGTVFRDVLDIAPGEDFVEAIRQRLAQAEAVLVLIGPRWVGDEGGTRRIDQTDDFVRIEVAAALATGARVVPVLLAGTGMPAAASLPEDIRPLARRNALALDEASWEADLARLLAVLRPAQSGWGARKLWTIGIAALFLTLAGVGLMRWQPWQAPVVEQPVVKEAPGAALVGRWGGKLRYSWGDSYDEVFEFKRHAGELTGTASFLRYPRAIEAMQFDGSNLHFETRSIEHMGESTKTVTRRYAAELQRDAEGELLAFRMQSTGGHSIGAPVEFVMRRLPDVVPAAASAPAN